MFALVRRATPLALALVTLVSTAAAAQDAIDDRAIDPAQPDFLVVNLPTTLRMPQWRGAIRVSHRFTRALGDGSFRAHDGDELLFVFRGEGGQAQRHHRASDDQES